jgi:nucleoid DNA-binding protein
MAKAEGVLNAVFNGMANSLARHERVEICGFCSMFIKQYE